MAKTTWDIEPVNPEGRAMPEPDKFREYAEDCQRIAQQLSPKDKEVMLEIARAWLGYAEQQEKNPKGNERL